MADINSLPWSSLLDESITLSKQVLDNYRPRLQIEEVGTVTYLGGGIAHAVGLPSVQAEELVRFPGNRVLMQSLMGVSPMTSLDRFGMAYNLDRDRVGIILLDDSEDLKAGCEVLRTGRVLDVPVGEELLGRVIDGTGRPLDNQGAISTVKRLPIEREAPGIM